MDTKHQREPVSVAEVIFYVPTLLLLAYGTISFIRLLIAPILGLLDAFR